MVRRWGEAGGMGDWGGWSMGDCGWWCMGDWGGCSCMGDWGGSCCACSCIGLATPPLALAFIVPSLRLGLVKSTKTLRYVRPENRHMHPEKNPKVQVWIKLFLYRN